jgi:hypothetical protein
MPRRRRSTTTATMANTIQGLSPVCFDTMLISRSTWIGKYNMSFTPAANYTLTTCGEPLKEGIEKKKKGWCMNRRVGNDDAEKQWKGEVNW